MLKVLKFKNLDKLFVTSDTHFCHRLNAVWEKRGNASPDEHDNNLIKKWNETVPLDGDTIHFGDFILNGSVEKCKEYAFRLNGHIYYCWGNHNSFIKELYKEALVENSYSLDVEVYPLTWKNKITFVGENLNFWAGKRFFVGSHFPYKIWDYMKWGAGNLSGHSHSGDKERNPDFKFHKTLDCGIDNFGKPVNIKTIFEILDKKEYIKMDEHH